MRDTSGMGVGVDYKLVEVAEQQLEDLVRRYSDKVEAGLKYVDHQHATNTGGRLDVLLMDSGGSLAVAELKVVEDDGMLLQGLDYYDYVASHLDAFTRLYQLPAATASQQVRLILIAPSFSQTLVNRCRWINAPLSLFTYSCLELEGTPDVLPIFNEVTLPSAPETVEVYHVNGQLNYITDDEARARYAGLLEEVPKLLPGRVSVDAIKYNTSLKVDGHVFAYLSARRKHFLVETYNADGVWTSYPIHSDDDMSAALEVMRHAMEARTR